MFEDIYSTRTGRFMARLLATPFISRLAGAFMDSRLSKPFIKPFARKNGIDFTEAAESEFKSFNAFFTRRLKSGARPVCPDEDAFVSPCDGLLSVYDISPDSRFTVKGTAYTVGELLDDEALAVGFDGGSCLVFRLTPAHYHRYIWPCEGKIRASKRIKGIYHTVRPAALSKVKVFKTNTREYALCDTPLFGELLIMEVGALLVGRIVNAQTDGEFKKGAEKGFFEFGGSTIVVLTQKGRVTLKPGLVGENEKPVRSGERLNA